MAKNDEKQLKPGRKAFSEAKRDAREQKSDSGLVVLDNPDDGEIFDTGANADVAGERPNKKDKMGGAPAR